MNQSRIFPVLVLLTIVLLIALTACTRILTLDELSPSDNVSTTVSPQATKPEPRIVDLGVNLGRWQGFHRLQFPADFPLKRLDESRATDFAKTLGLVLAEDDFSSITNISDADNLALNVAAQIEVAFGAQASIDFEMSRLIGNIAGMHEYYFIIFDQEEPSLELFTSALAFLDEAKSLAKSAGADSSTLTEIEAVAAELRAWPDTEEAYLAIGDKMVIWVYAAQYATRGLAEPTPLPTLVPTPTVTNMAGTNIQKQLPIGNPDNAKSPLTKNACVACHSFDNATVAPAWKAEEYADNQGIGTRAKGIWQSDSYTGNATNATEYLYEAIALPGAYINEGYPDVMPQNYGKQLSEQELADVIAYLLNIE